jgi:hypothetical protein
VIISFLPLILCYAASAMVLLAEIPSDAWCHERIQADGVLIALNCLSGKYL